MKDYPQIKETKREFIREKRRNIKEGRDALKKLRNGCALFGIFGGGEFKDACLRMQSALRKMDDITKTLR